MLFQAPVSTTAVSQEPFPPEIQPRAPPLQPPPFAASSSTYPFPDLSPGAQPTNGQRDGAGFPDAVFSAPPFAFGQEGRSNVEGNGLDALLRGMFDGSMQGALRPAATLLCTGVDLDAVAPHRKRSGQHGACRDRPVGHSDTSSHQNAPEG